MKVLVCGSRNMFHTEDNLNLMLKTLTEYFNGPEDVLIHGDARGADKLSEHAIRIMFSQAKEKMPQINVYPADWDKYGKAAGPIRNKQMLDEGKPDLVVAFPGGKGTAHMVKIAKEAQVQVIEVNV